MAEDIQRPVSPPLSSSDLFGFMVVSVYLDSPARKPLVPRLPGNGCSDKSDANGALGTTHRYHTLVWEGLSSVRPGGKLAGVGAMPVPLRVKKVISATFLEDAHLPAELIALSPQDQPLTYAAREAAVTCSETEG